MISTCKFLSSLFLSISKLSFSDHDNLSALPFSLFSSCTIFCLSILTGPASHLVLLVCRVFAAFFRQELFHFASFLLSCFCFPFVLNLLNLAGLKFLVSFFASKFVVDVRYLSQNCPNIMKEHKQISLSPSTVILTFGIATLCFYFLLMVFLPLLKNTFSFHPSITYWFITGSALFVPLFLYAIHMAKKEGNEGINQILLALDVKPFSDRDWIYASTGLSLLFVLDGVIVVVLSLLNTPLSTGPWFLEIHELVGNERFLLLVWLFMLFFNICGEEFLWRGYLQKRLPGKSSWILCSFCWLAFHTPFGIDLMIMLLPAVMIIPYIYSQTRNTLACIFIHGLYNGPIFVAIALGYI